MALVDLDDQVTRIRDLRSRSYFLDALKAFRAGALRASISTLWVSIAFDLIRKYRELETAGDLEARNYLRVWDTAVANNNVSKLLELERDLLDHAHSKMGLVDIHGLRALQRIVEDRHLCAHPAFAGEDQLFEPSDELVRAHLATAIELVLAQRPVQGKGIFEAFSIDVQSPGFPSTQQTTTDYVEQKYLRNMRQNVIRNFGVVLVKAIVQDVPPEWTAHRQKVIATLTAIRQRRVNEWADVASDLVMRIGNDDPAHRLRCIAALAAFPELAQRVEPAAITALNQEIANSPGLEGHPEVFGAVNVEPLRAALEHRFARLDVVSAANVLSFVAPAAFWPAALDWYGRSASYRNAEANYDDFIAPFQPDLSVEQLSNLFLKVADNGQIWDAGRTPAQILTALQAASPRRPSDQATNQLYWGVGRNARVRFEEIWQHLERLGWVRPTQRPEE